MIYSLTWLPGVLRGAGLKVAEVEGWESRGVGDVGDIAGVICHHTAGPRNGNMPSLGTLVSGRPDLSGPLAQIGLGRDGTCYVIAAGRCNHAGAGAWQGIKMGNARFIGIEAENTGDDDDYPWPAVQMDAYRRCVAAGACTPPASGQYCNAELAGHEAHPVNCVTHAQAVAYCKFADQRLPTEAEWEWAARGAKAEVRVAERACWDRVAGTCEAGKTAEDAVLGVLDLSGNVREWTADFYGSYAPGAPISTARRVVRGGSWRSRDRADYRITARAKLEPTYQGDALGFRCAKDP